MADNRKMWSDLGMNLELHDQLCEVLPQAFGDVFLFQENRPESMDYYNMVVADIHGISVYRALRRISVLGTWGRESTSYQYLSSDQGFCGSKTGPYLSVFPYCGYVYW